jgi:hypothetical protein
MCGDIVVSAGIANVMADSLRASRTPSPAADHVVDARLVDGVVAGYCEAPGKVIVADSQLEYRE